MSLIQKLFDKAVTHLLTQMEQSIDDDGSCVYRGPNDLKCAIGALIDDDLYNDFYWAKTLEHFNVTSRCVQAIVAKSQDLNLPDLDGEDWVILQAVQNIHDKYLPNEWKDKLTALAEEHNLTMPNLDFLHGNH